MGVQVSIAPDFAPRGVDSGMPFRIMIAAFLASLVFLGLAYLPDPKVIGITSEPARILLYGGSGIMSAVCFLVGLIAGAFALAGRSRNGGPGRR